MKLEITPGLQNLTVIQSYIYIYHITFLTTIGGDGFECTASILSESFVMTAAHCFDKSDLDICSVIAGTTMVSFKQVIFKIDWFFNALLELL